MSQIRDVAKAIRARWDNETDFDLIGPERQQPWLEMAVCAIRAIEQGKRMEPKQRLVDDWRNWHRWWSMRLNALGLAILTWVQFDPVGVLYVWSLMPDEVRFILPPRVLVFVGLGLFALSMIARVVKQNDKKA